MTHAQIDALATEFDKVLRWHMTAKDECAPEAGVWQVEQPDGERSEQARA